VLADPVLEDLVERVDVLQPALIVQESGVLDQLRTLDRLEHAFGDGLGARRYRDRPSVAGLVDVSRRRGGRAVARPSLDLVELVVA
jgi:hypothetical protein